MQEDHNGEMRIRDGLDMRPLRKIILFKTELVMENKHGNTCLMKEPRRVLAQKKCWEELNKIAHEKAMLKENPDFMSPFGNVEVTTTEKNIKNFEKVNRIKKVVVDKKVFSNKEIKV